MKYILSQIKDCFRMAAPLAFAGLYGEYLAVNEKHLALTVFIIAIILQGFATGVWVYLFDEDKPTENMGKYTMYETILIWLNEETERVKIAKPS